MNNSGQAGIIVSFVMMVMVFITFTIMIAPINSFIDDQITTHNYTGMLKVFLLFMPIILFLIMLGRIGLIALFGG